MRSELPMDSETSVLNGLMSTLHGLPMLGLPAPSMKRQRATNHGYVPDARIAVKVGGKDLDLVVEAKKSVYPREVRDILWKLLDFTSPLGKRAIPLVAAESMSPGAKELLRAKSVGYYDSGGSLFIPAAGAYIYIERPPPASYERSVRSLYRGSRAQVLHALLVRPHEWFSVKDLARLAAVASSTVSETLTELERLDWIETRGQGPSKERLLRQPTALLDEWTNRLRADGRSLAGRRYYVRGTDPDRLARQLDSACAAHRAIYVLTAETGGQRLAPFLTSVSRVRCRMQPGLEMDAALKELGARLVTEGSNLKVIVTHSEGPFLFKIRVDDAWVASPIQVYLDLLHKEGRSQELADHLRRERIGF
jgi:DNA-binding transcriptional ArsR family regulator